MVNQAEQPENIDSVPVVDTGGTTTDITPEFEGVNTFEDVGTPSQDLAAEPAEGDVAPVSPTSDESVPGTPPPSPEDSLPSLVPQDEIRQRVQQLEQQNRQYEQSQQHSQVQAQYEKYKTDLENAGYLPDQAEHVASTWYSSAIQQSAVQQQQQEMTQFIQGQQIAAEHFATKYNLGLGDLKELRQHQTPDAMEAAAKRMASDNEKDTEIARLRAQLVPSQSFEDNQSSPAASSDEDRWLERYNQGDRSPQASNAARKAAGLG